VPAGLRLEPGAWSRAPAMSTSAHRILGDKYRLVHPLHKGGMGSVWLAEHLSLGSPIAVKLLAPDVAMTEERLSRFLREARAAAALRSPHVVQILDYGVDGGAPFIVMELLEGESLAHRLSRLGRLELGETARVIQHVSRAVAKAHDMGIVHRDLKPANIFITHNDEEEVIKIFDFGIAKATLEGAIGTLANQTRTEALLGTPVYMSPEQFEGSRRCDLRTDIWAMGVITFECLLGRLPFVGPGIGGLVLDICSRPLPVPSEHGDVPAGFDDWFARACARKLSDRFQNAREAAQELLRLLEPGVDGELRPQLPSAAEPAASVPDAWEAASGEPLDHEGAPNRVPSAPVLPTTGAASSVTIDRGRRRSFVRPFSLLASLIGFVFLLIALYRVVRWPVAAETVVQAIEPQPVAAGLIALGDGSELRLTVDGREIGLLPQELHGLAPGEHSVMITGGVRYRPYRTGVVLSPGLVTSVGPVKLQVAKGLATIVPGSGAEGATVSLESGGSQVRLSELPVQLDVATDEPHVLRAEREGYAPYEQVLTFGDGQAERTFSIMLAELEKPSAATERRATPARRGRARLDRKVHAARPAASAGKAMLTLRSTPDAAVLLDGIPMGSTPLEDVRVTPGSHRVIFVYGAQRQARRVTVAARQNRMVSASFSTAPDAQ
jgi:serine/threonine protein kinase